MSDEAPKKELTVREAGSLGGKATRDRHGPEHYQRMGSKGGNTTRERKGSEHYARIGHQGGTTTSKRYGDEHYQRIGAKGGARIQELLARGRAAEAAATGETEEQPSAE